MVEGTPLLREHAAKKLHRGFESLRLRQNSLMPCASVSTPIPIRDRLLVLAALAAVVAVAWAALAYLAIGRPAMDMTSDSMPMMPAMRWDAGIWVATAAMWMVMMAGMMLPSAAPTILLFDALQRHGARGRGATVVFAAGYLLAWSALSVVATTAQWALNAAMLLSSTMQSASPVLTGVLLLVAGAYQFSSWKGVCLRRCRSPAAFLVGRSRGGPLGPLLMGLDHGLYCVGCCWALMALLFAFGVMNLLWVAVLAIFVLVEKLSPGGVLVGRVGGLVMIGTGAALLGTG